MKENQDLKPCPFCGGNAEVISGNTTGKLLYTVSCKIYKVFCTNCNARTAEHKKYKYKAIKAWNRRS